MAAGFRKPWQDGAKAYHQADSLDAIAGGIKRMRKPLTVLISHETHSLDGVPCDYCGHDLAGGYPLNGGEKMTGPDVHAYIDVDPRSKTYTKLHYYCAWTATFAEIERHRLVLEGRAA